MLINTFELPRCTVNDSNAIRCWQILRQRYMLSPGDKLKEHMVLSLWLKTFQKFALPVFINATKSEGRKQEQDMCAFKVLSAVTVTWGYISFSQSTKFTPENDILYYFQEIN